jgi:hypothetical protein
MKITTWAILGVLALVDFAVLGVMIGIVTSDSAYGALPPTPARRAVAIQMILPTRSLPQPPTIEPTATATRVIPVAFIDQRNPGQARAMHIVQPGQSLLQIANGYGVPQDSILQINGLQSADSVSAGFTLLIPGPNDLAPLFTPTATSTPTARPTRRPRPPTATPSPTFTLTPSPAPIYVTSAPAAAGAGPSATPSGRCDKRGADGKCKCAVMKGGRCKHEHDPNAPRD